MVSLSENLTIPILYGKEPAMDVTSLLTGSAGKILSAGNIIIILILMFIVSVRLYMSRKKRAYLSITVSIVFLITQYAITIALELGADNYSLTSRYLHQVLQMVAFVLANMGIYQLYNRSKRRDFFVFYAALLIAMAVSVFFFPSPQLSEASVQEQMLQFVGLDLYLLLLIFLAFYIIPPHIGQVGKFRFGLLTYFLFHLAHIVNRYVFIEPNTFYTVVENLLPIVYFAILFLFLFDRVVEILQAVYHSSITDGLTGVYNRTYFFNRVNQYATRKIKIGIIFTDIDNFKKLNDTKGHQMGDEVLKKVAAILKEEAEDIGIAGRYGGEELVMMIADSRVNMRELAEKLRKRVAEETIVTVSVGYAVYRGQVSGQTLIKQADEAMYHSKTTGKNKVTSYSEMRKSPAAH